MTTEKEGKVKYGQNNSKKWTKEDHWMSRKPHGRNNIRNILHFHTCFLYNDYHCYFYSSLKTFVQQLVVVICQMQITAIFRMEDLVSSKSQCKSHHVTCYRIAFWIVFVKTVIDIAVLQPLSSPTSGTNCKFWIKLFVTVRY